MVYLFIGADSPYKDTPLSQKDFFLKQIKEQFLPKAMEQFNLDTLYAESLSLNALQEKLLGLPVNCSIRIIVIKNAQELSADLEGFILEWAKKAPKDVILLLDIEQRAKKEEFIKNIFKYAKIFRFKEGSALNTFNLTRSIEERRPQAALLVLNQLLNDGERPERILGGLRYALENSHMNGSELKRRVKFLLEADIEIKTGRSLPVFALEKLIVKLCSLAQPLH